MIFEHCQEKEVVVGGYFYVSTYSPATMSLVGFPNTGQVKVANCAAAELIPIDPGQAGWVSLGGAAKGLDTDGCNPALEPCGQGTVPVQPSTWGRIKKRY